jgi:hypothetical protein
VRPDRGASAQLGTPQAPTVTDTNPDRKRVHYAGATFVVSTEVLFFIVVALAGALGGLIHTIRSIAWYIGSRRLRWSWIPFYVLLPVVGALGGTVFYLVFRAGLFSPSTDVQQASPFGFAAVAVLVGLFSEEAMNKLREVAQNLFASTPPGPDHFDVPDRATVGWDETGDRTGGRGGQGGQPR